MYFTGGLFSMSLMTSDIEYLFMSLVSTYMFVDKSLFKHFAYFFTRLEV